MLKLLLCWGLLLISSLKVQTGLSEGYGFHSDNVPVLVDVTDSILHDTFSSRFPSVKAAKVVSDANTERSTGSVFIRFGDDNESSQAMTEMNGVCCSSRPMLIGAATPSFFLVVFNKHQPEPPFLGKPTKFRPMLKDNMGFDLLQYMDTRIFQIKSLSPQTACKFQIDIGSRLVYAFLCVESGEYWIYFHDPYCEPKFDLES
ncbi:hypothetical protein RIF29_37813 [Crotalaria pallida]|uniref:RRM domain-containing protein n=1 Tax=Crotalaria pallida TaxID=3830 RepID=A0AAN9HN78_CROPI